MSVKNVSYISKDLLQYPEIVGGVKADIQRVAGNGQFFTAYFRKANGDLRKMNCRLKVKKYFRTPDGKGIHKKVDYPNRLTVWDRDSLQYRTISLDRLERLVMAGKTVIFN